MVGTVFYFSGCEFLLTVAALHGHRIAPYFPEDTSPAEMILLPDKGDEFVDLPGSIDHVFRDHTSMEVNEDFGFLALHPFTLLEGE